MTFKDDLIKGKTVEHLICDIIKKKYPKAYVVEGYKKEYDIVIPEKEWTLEVKYDPMSETTGNYMIETSYEDKPSGISTTEAYWWIHVDNECINWIPVKSLKYILQDYKIKDMQGVGDSGCKSGYLIPVMKLRNNPYNKFYKLNKK